MGSSSSISRKQGLRVGILVIILVVCAWITPFSPAVAASGSSQFSVTVSVQDTNAVDMSDRASEMIGSDEVDVSFIQRPVTEAEGNEVEYSEVMVSVSKL